MRRRLSVALAILVASSAFAQTDTTRLRWVPNPRPSGSWVSDPANHLAAPTRHALDSIITALVSANGSEMAVVVIDSLDGLEPGAAALLLHRRWGVGKRARDNGIVFLWSPRLRKTYVSVGYGLEGALPDAVTGRILDDSVLPAFRRGDFDAGILGGTRAMAAVARGEAFTGRERKSLREQDDSFPWGWVLWPIAVLAAIPASLLGWRAWRLRKRRCPKCGSWMYHQKEKADDAYLAKEELLEEKLGSVDYHVWKCSGCDNRVVEAEVEHSKIEKCPKCKRRTLKRKSSKILIRPTQRRRGSRMVVRECKNCGHTTEKEESIPKLESTATSSGGRGGFSSGGSGGSGGGGGSFGGGSTGGGGAGRSY